VVFLALVQDAVGLNLWSTRAESGTENPAIQKVITMLENLIDEMDKEAAQDEKQFAEFDKWCKKTEETTSASIKELNTNIQTLSAALAELYAEKEKLEKHIADLKSQIETTRSQINMATEKRGEEHDSFTKEQTDFDNSIAACKKAVDILKVHYGDPAGPLEKPDFMGLVQTKNIIKNAVSRRGIKVHPKLLSFIQASHLSSEPRFQDARSESMSIVDQMQMLADTFTDDKQSAVDEEERLQKLYTTLMTEKTAQLNTLTAELDDRESVLNAVNQDIAEKESAKAIAEAELKDEQAYLSQTRKTCSDTKALFELRKHDREEETIAVKEAVKVLSPQAALIQLDDSSSILHKGKNLVKHLGKHQGKNLGKHLAQHKSHDKTGHKGKHLARHRSHHRSHHKHRQVRQCAGCRKAASLLASASRRYQSDMLAAASAAVQGSDALKDVVSSLEELIRRVDEEQETETKHKEWCEGELSTTTHKKTTHEGHVEELTNKIADTGETIVEKKQGLIEVADSIARADKNFEEATRIRETEKEAFDVENQNTKDAIAALNQAISILAGHYAKKGALLEESDDASIKPRDMEPGIFDGLYESKGGSGVVQMISQVRQEFEVAKAHLEKGEAQAITDFNAGKDAYQAARNDLVSNQDKLTVEKQTAEASLSQFKEDKINHQEEITAATTYLGQLSGSCDSLLQHFDERVKLRNEEKDAIKKAINVLENES